MLKKVGITTLNDESDCNPAAISLGGLTYGLTPLEEAAAYETFVNGGVYKTPIFYTKVLDSNNNTLFEKQAEETQVYDPGVAWIMTDVLHTVVTKGIGRSAYISSQPAGGKTGTTSNMYDIWFSGFTPYYSMALWMGNDINMSVSNYSYKAAGFWAAIMERVCADLPRASFSEKPANVTVVNGEYYTEGTYSKVAKRKSKTKKSKSETESTTISETVTLPPATTAAPASTAAPDTTAAPAPSTEVQPTQDSGTE
jgi:penicillin-binding protein 1A